MLSNGGEGEPITIVSYFGAAVFHTTYEGTQILENCKQQVKPTSTDVVS